MSEARPLDPKVLDALKHAGDGVEPDGGLQHAPVPGDTAYKRRCARIGYRDGWVCHYCNHRLSRNDPRFRSPTLDHVLPVSRGGKTELANLVLACPKCNREKDDRTPAEWLRRACCEKHEKVQNDP